MAKCADPAVPLPRRGQATAVRRQLARRGGAPRPEPFGPPRPAAQILRENIAQLWPKRNHARRIFELQSTARLRLKADDPLDEIDLVHPHAAEPLQEGRRMHVGATAELQAVADEAVEIVRVMYGLNRYGSRTTRGRWRCGRVPAMWWVPRATALASRIREHAAGRRRAAGRMTRSTWTAADSRECRRRCGGFRRCR